MRSVCRRLTLENNLQFAWSDTEACQETLYLDGRSQNLPDSCCHLASSATNKSPLKFILEPPDVNRLNRPIQYKIKQVFVSAKMQLAIFFPQVRPAVQVWTNPPLYPCPTASASSDRAAAPHVIARDTTVTATNLSENEREKEIKTETGVTLATTTPGTRRNLTPFC